MLFQSCASDRECRQTAEASLGAEFYHTDFSIVEEQYVSETLADTFKIYGLNNDSLLADNAVIKEIRLPLNPFSNQSTYIFERKNLMSDTIIFFYENENNFISLECGCLVFNRITDIEHTLYNIDSVIITNNFISNDKEKNIKIYFKNR